MIDTKGAFTRKGYTVIGTDKVIENSVHNGTQ